MSRRQEMAAAMAVAAALILFRSFVYLVYEQSFFDSDQAIIGLMAKHLAEGRAFPLFYYGQTYMLGVDAWVAAPIFLIAGPTVATLHTATLLLNIAAALAMLMVLAPAGGIRPLVALIPVSFFALAPAELGQSLIEAGANIGPLLYVPLLWLLRTRPLWFGLVLGVGVLNREFTIYAVPVLLAGDVWIRSLWKPARVRHWLLVAVATLATWQAIQGLKPFSDMMGPGTRGALVSGEAGSQIENVADRVAIQPSEFPGRVRAMLTSHLPRLFGAWPSDVMPAPVGHAWLLWPMALALPVLLLRSMWLTLRNGDTRRSAAGWYFAGVGALAVAGYVATRPADGMVTRYLLLAIFVPVGILAAHVLVETRRSWLWLAAGLAVTCALTSAVDATR